MEKEVDPSFHLEQSNYNMFVKKAKGKSVLMFFYVSADSSSQSLSLQFFQTALAFKSLHSLLFASVDCSENRTLCSYSSCYKGLGTSTAKEGKEYAKLRGMENVLRQFVKLEFEKGKVVGGDGSIVKSSSCWMRTTSMPW